MRLNFNKRILAFVSVLVLAVVALGASLPPISLQPGDSVANNCVSTLATTQVVGTSLVVTCPTFTPTSTPSPTLAPILACTTATPGAAQIIVENQEVAHRCGNVYTVSFDISRGLNRVPAPTTTVFSNGYCGRPPGKTWYDDGIFTNWECSDPVTGELDYYYVFVNTNPMFEKTATPGPTP